MKIIRGFKIRGFILAAAVSAGFGFIFPASAKQEVPYIVDLNTRRVTSLGTLGGYYSYASAINDSGQIVGSSYTAGGRTCFYYRTQRRRHD